MKIRYTEELIKDVVQHQIYPDAPEEVVGFTLDNLVTAILKKTNGEKTRSSCLLDVNERGILFVLMDNFRADKASGYQLFKFSDMQGIKIKEKLFYNYITLQFTDGTNYEFQIIKRSNKQLPNQSSRIYNINAILYDQNLNEMHNSMYKKKTRKNKITVSLQFITQIIFVIIGLILALKYAPNNSFIAFIIIVSAVIIHFILSMIVTGYVDKRNR